jgi:hypothetical protein
LGGGDAIQKASIVAVEEVFDSGRNIDLEELDIEFQEEHDGEHAMGLGTKGSRVEAKGRAFALPKNNSADS